MKNKSVDRLLNPNSVAVVGASEKDGYGARLMRNMLSRAYSGKIYPVNHTRKNVMGLSCYPSISAIGKPVDLVVIIVKVEYVEKIIQECANCGVGGVLIITAGYRELDPIKGPHREHTLKKIAQNTGMRIAGPNCLGIANIGMEMWACAFSTMYSCPITSGNVALISQSGATGFGPLLSIAIDRNVGLKYLITTGNETDLNMSDYIEYMIYDNSIKSIGVLIEGLKDAERFAILAREAQRQGKTIVSLKIGESEVGSRAAASHTASMTGSMEIFNAFATQNGIIKAEDYDELIELLSITSARKSLKGKNLAVFAASGGISGFTGDLLCKHGFNIPILCERTQADIDAFLKGFGSPRNPLDLTMHMRQPYIYDMVKSIENNNDIDGYVFSTNGNKEAMLNIVNAANSLNKPSYFIWTGRLCDNDGQEVIRQAQYPLSYSIQKFAVMLEKVANVQRANEIDALAATISISEECSGFLNEYEAKRIIAKAGVKIPPVVFVERDLDTVQLEFNGNDRYVGKIVSRDILHKSDIGGVIPNICNQTDALEALDRLKQVESNCGGKLEGFMFEEMCDDGFDVVIGIRRDEIYGHVLMIGLGGIYTELFKMVSIRVLPISRNEISLAIDEIPGLPEILAGFRGQAEMDRESLVEIVKILCDIVSKNNKRVELLEINPLRVMKKGSGVCALDCVMELN